jgi:hypothetical protein
VIDLSPGSARGRRLVHQLREVELLGVDEEVAVDECQQVGCRGRPVVSYAASIVARKLVS